MKMFSFLNRKKDTGAKEVTQKSASSARSSAWVSMLVKEPFSGAWQRNKELKKETSLSHYAAFSCISNISQDIAKLPFVFMRQSQGVDQHVDHEVLKMLRKPNLYQNHIQFKEVWISSKLLHGNTYVLKERHNGSVVGLHVLDPGLVKVLVTDQGDVYYELKTDKLAKVSTESVVVPAYDIIHDRFNCYYHPLIGLSPISFMAVSINQGLEIQNNSYTFFGNRAVPSGILTAPGAISDDTAGRLKKNWEENYSGDGSGKVAVLGDGLKFEPMGMTAVDSQLIEQLKLTAEMICSAYRVPTYVAGVSDKRPQADVEAIYLEYYQSALQYHIESLEVGLDDGLGFDGVTESIDIDIKNLMRMDTASRYKAHGEAVKGGWKKINEVRAEEGLLPVVGGDTPYLQQQNYSLEALSKRDAQDDPFGKKAGKPAPETPDDESEKAFLTSLIKEFKVNG